MHTHCLNLLVGATNPTCQNVLKSWLFLWTVACRSRRISQRLRELLAITNPEQLCKGGWGRFLCVSRQRFPPTAVLAFCVRVIICSWLTAKGFYFGFTDYGKTLNESSSFFCVCLSSTSLGQGSFWKPSKMLVPSCPGSISERSEVITAGCSPFKHFFLCSSLQHNPQAVFRLHKNPLIICWSGLLN